MSWIIEKAKQFQKSIYFCFIDYTKAFDSVDHNKLWKNFKRWEYQTTSPASWEICMLVKKPQLELDMENAREFCKNIYFCFIDYTKTFECVDHKKLWEIP